MNRYGEQEKVSTKAEHLLPPVLTYVLRKILLYALVINISVIRQLSKVYGFRFHVEFSDREKWKWDLKQKIPLYTAKVEKVD